MSQNRTLHIDLIRDRHTKPLAIVKNFPGLDAEMYSEQLRKMADQLSQAADDLDALNSEQPKTISLDELMARKEQERGIKPLPLEPELLLERITQGGHSGQFLAEAFLSTYRTGRPFQHSLCELTRLDAEGFRLFHEILHIRHIPGWSDDALYQIEQQIKTIIKGVSLMSTTKTDLRTVNIPASTQYGGRHVVTVLLDWHCPVCGQPRGNIRGCITSDLTLRFNSWRNPCGHIDEYETVLQEAANNGLNNPKSEVKGWFIKTTASNAQAEQSQVKSIIGGEL